MNADTLKRGFDFDRIDTSSLEDSQIIKETGNRPPSRKVALTKENIIEIIFQKMQQKGGFPSFSKQISDINKILKLKYASAKDIANVIVKDFTLSNKILKLVNSSFYGQFSKDGISSVEKAMIILGADQIQQAAASLMLFEHMQTSSNSQELKTTAVKTFMSGMIAKEIAEGKNYNSTEEFLICAMFYKLGENLIAYYFEEKRSIILKLSGNKEISDNMASRTVLGITYQELGIGVAKKWGLPENIIFSMHVKKSVTHSATAFAGSRIELLGTLASFSNELCDIQFSKTIKDKSTAIKRVVRNYKGKLGIDNDMISSILSRVAKKIKTHSSQLNINVESFNMLSGL